MNRTRIVSPQTSPKIQRTGEPQQLTTGPVPARKPRPQIALLREALDAFGVHGMCRLVAFEVFTYWEPGGSVFLLMKTISEGVGINRRIVRSHLARLERIGIWTRGARKGQSNIYKFQLPGSVGKTEVSTSECGSYDPPPRIVGSSISNHLSRRSELRASAAATSTVRTEVGSQARPLKGASSPLPEPSAKRQETAVAAIAAYDATFDPIAEGQRWAEAVEAKRPVVTRVVGCPACGSDRLMGGSCEQCGHDTGSQFLASADWNMGGDT